jgi:hypothetical protein
MTTYTRAMVKGKHNQRRSCSYTGSPNLANIDSADNFITKRKCAGTVDASNAAVDGSAHQPGDLASANAESAESNSCRVPGTKHGCVIKMAVLREPTDHIDEWQGGVAGKDEMGWMREGRPCGLNRNFCSVATRTPHPTTDSDSDSPTARPLVALPTGIVADLRHRADGGAESLRSWAVVYDGRSVATLRADSN